MTLNHHHLPPWSRWPVVAVGRRKIQPQAGKLAWLISHEQEKKEGSNLDPTALTHKEQQQENLPGPGATMATVATLPGRRNAAEREKESCRRWFV